jgi:lipopolysaccharide transport system ATP-binding protein
MTQVWIENAANKIVDRVASGSKIAIAVEYESSGTKHLKNVRASIAVQDMYEQHLFLCSTELASSAVDNCPPSGVLRFIIPNLPLSGGSYNLLTFFEVDGVAQDCVNNAASIDVEDGDFYGSGKLYPPGWGGKGVLLEHQCEWRNE